MNHISLNRVCIEMMIVSYFVVYRKILFYVFFLAEAGIRILFLSRWLGDVDVCEREGVCVCVCVCLLFVVFFGFFFWFFLAFSLSLIHI